MPKPLPKIIIATIPVRAEPTTYPPIACLSIINALRKAGLLDSYFYNIDLLRPSIGEIVNYIEKEKPDILGISAVVSTSYRYVKQLSLELKKTFPSLTIVLGGVLGASAEILLKKTGIDFVCTGEGERTMVEFVRCWQEGNSKLEFAQIPGLAFLGDDGDLVVTPYPKTLSPDELYDCDWSILDSLGQMEYYCAHNNEKEKGFDMAFALDSRSQESRRKGKAMYTLVTSKGCVAKCTFCHRWDPGIRYIPIPVLMGRIDLFIEKYDMGFVDFQDENFGSDKKWLKVFLKEIKKRDILWRVGGMRVNSLEDQTIKDMKDAGCTMINCGMESGSQKMLDVMGKVTTMTQNRNAVKWLAANKVQTCLQLILGMPGETAETMQETMDFACFYVEESPDIDPNDMGINTAQALPGTPLYEYGRRKGFIGQTLDGEEEHLLKISDRDARDLEAYVNYTDYPRLWLEKWHLDIQIKTRMVFIKKWGIERYFKNNTALLPFADSGKKEKIKRNLESGSFGYPAKGKEELAELLREQNTSSATLNKNSPNESEDALPSYGFFGKGPSLFRLLKSKKFILIPYCYPKFFWRARMFSIVFVFGNCIRKFGLISSLGMLGEYLKWFLSDKNILKKPIEYISLRKTVLKNLIPVIEGDNPMMAKLRKGR